MKKGFIALLILVLCALVQFAYGAAGDVASIGGKAITAIASVDGKANAGIASFCGKPVSDGDSTSGSIGSSATGTYGGGYSGAIIYQAYTTVTAGTISYCHLRVSGGNGLTFPVAIYNTSGERLAYGAETAPSNTEQWLNISLNTSITIVESTTYWLASSCSTAWTASFIADSGGTGSVRSLTNAYANPLPASVTDNAEVAPGIKQTFICNNSSGSPE